MASSPTRIRYSPDGSRRQGHLLSLMGASNRLSDRKEGRIDPYMYLNVGVFLAFRHVQQRNGTVLPSLAERLAGCDFDWTFSTRDTQFSPRKGVEELVAATAEPTMTRKRRLTTNITVLPVEREVNTPPSPHDDWQFPFAIVSDVYSRNSIPVALLGQGLALPQISGSATSSALDYAPFFSRTIATTKAEASAAMLYYQSIGVTHVGCFFVQDPWGNSFAKDLQNAAYKLGINSVAFPYDDGNKVSIQNAMQNLKDSGMRHIFAIMFSWKPIIEVAIDMELIGNPDHVWIGAAMIEWTSGVREFNRSNPNDLRIAQALRGVGSLTLDGGNNREFDEAMNEFANNPDLQNEYIQAYPPADRFIYNNYTFLENVQDYFFQRAFYDATYGLAIAACETPGLFKGEELYKTLVNLEYEGVTGKIEFDLITGTRKPETVAVQIDNVFWSGEKSDDDFIRLDSQRAVKISAGQVEHTRAWLYYGNTSKVPLSIPAIEHDYNLMPVGVQIVGWLLGGFVVCLSLSIIGWTYCNRNIFVVKAGQPQFLYQICVGTMLMALAVIPMSMQGTESTAQLNRVCMAVPWLVFCGFVVAFSALFSKTWRLNKIMNSGMAMRRIHVEPKDAVGPFVILMSLTVAMLLGWSIVSPLEYVRVAGSNVDRYGQSLESHGQCQSKDNKYLGFLIPMLFFNFIGLVKATYQSYVARNLPTELSESSYLALGMASLLETLLLGGPIFFMVMNNPTAAYLVGSSLLLVLNIAILLPVFLPKFINRGMAARRSMGSLVLSRASQLTLQSQELNTRLSQNPTLVSKRGFMYVTRTPAAGQGRRPMASQNRYSSSHFLSQTCRNTIAEGGNHVHVRNAEQDEHPVQARVSKVKFAQDAAEEDGNP